MDEKGHSFALAMSPLQPLQPDTPFLSAQSTAGMKQGTIVLVATSQTAAKISALVKGAANTVNCSHHHSYMSINTSGIGTGLLPPQINAISCQTTLSCQGDINRTTNRSQFYTDLKNSLTLGMSRSHRFKAKVLFTSKVSYKCKTQNKLANVYVYCCSLRGWIRRAEQGESGSALLTQSAWKVQFLFHRKLWCFLRCFHLQILLSIPNLLEKAFRSVDGERFLCCSMGRCCR